MITMLAGATLALAPQPAPAADAPGASAAPYVFTPDAAAQAALADLAAGPDAGARSTALESVRTLDAADRPALLRNLAAFTRDAQTTRGGMVAGAVIRELAIPADDVVTALVPLLDTADADLRAEAANMLGTYEDRSASRAPDFSR
ncbi:MAG TPA: hypothetical protein P5572_21875, partial [Phycisphaerae bacterium]|nr:hypothetical protein [Phycisphaerae bacterium]